MAPEQTDLPSLTGSVTGQVTENGEGIKDARVTLVGHERLKDKTDENGRFLIKNTPAGDMVVEVFHKNSSKLVKVTIEQGETSQCPNIEFSQLPEEADIEC